MVVQPDLSQRKHFRMSKNLNQLWQLHWVVVHRVVRVPSADGIHILVFFDKGKRGIPVVGFTPNDHDFLYSRRKSIGHDLVRIGKVFRILNMAVSIDQHVFE